MKHDFSNIKNVDVHICTAANRTQKFKFHRILHLVKTLSGYGKTVGRDCNDSAMNY